MLEVQIFVLSFQELVTNTTMSPSPHAILPPRHTGSPSPNAILPTRFVKCLYCYIPVERFSNIYLISSDYGVYIYMFFLQ